MHDAVPAFNINTLALPVSYSAMMLTEYMLRAAAAAHPAAP